MRTKNFATILTFVITLFVASCAKEGPPGPTGPAGPSLAGSISGHVMLFDKYGSKVLTGLNNVGLYFNGSSTPVFPDTNGYYIFNNLVTGVYNVAAAITGYGTTNIPNIELVSGALNTDVKLSAVPDSFINSFTAMLKTDSTGDSLRITCTADTRARSCIVFLNKTATVSNAPAYYLLSYIADIPAAATAVSISVPKQDLLNAGLASADTVYLAAYSHAFKDVSAYEDVSTGKIVYNAVNANAVFSYAIVP